MPPVTAVPTGGQHGPSNFDKLKMGAMMGGTVGTIMGFIFGTNTEQQPDSMVCSASNSMTGTVNIFRYGAGTQGIMRTLGQYMLVSGTTFGFFMSIGSVIRSDADPKLHELYMRAQRRPIVNMASPAWRKSP
ncbi:hypothetical protein MHUMG1_08474 [Metarhizium humberi]|uniref:Mitochondrial genome maintenance protein Mgr2 n=4 Tax=Metarhizium TaxID=5529 RepID=A0A9P8M4N5_9HYPO